MPEPSQLTMNLRPDTAALAPQEPHLKQAGQYQ